MFSLQSDLNTINHRNLNLRKEELVLATAPSIWFICHNHQQAISSGVSGETWTVPTLATSSAPGREPRTDRWSTTAGTPALTSSRPLWPQVWGAAWCLTSSPVTFTGARWRSMSTSGGEQSSRGDRRQTSSTDSTTGQSQSHLSALTSNLQMDL